VGDGLLFCLNNRRYVNHVGAFVGNGFVLHHLYQRESSVDPLTPVWRNRIVSIVRHPEVTELNRKITPPTNLMDVLPPHLKAKYAAAM
jgi:cell wall-associated NlpC family hydrolase